MHLEQLTLRHTKIAFGMTTSSMTQLMQILILNSMIIHRLFVFILGKLFSLIATYVCSIEDGRQRSSGPPDKTVVSVTWRCT